jgi:tartrate/fumarate subfamily iron-sulfur-dependent hydro-lyase alpha chain
VKSLPISEELIEDVVSKLYERALKELPEDVLEALQRAHEREANPLAKEVLSAIIENSKVARSRNLLICQDTCIPAYWLKVGTRAVVEGDPIRAIEEGSKKATREIPLIPHCVHPITRANTGTNVGPHVPVLHIDLLPGADYIEITAMPIGSGSETAPSALRIFSYADPIGVVKKFILDTVVEAGGKPCPPIIVGVGIGGSFDYVGWLAKMAAFRPLNLRNPDPEAKMMEEELLSAINMTGIGPMGMGGDTTALAVNIEVGHTHTTEMPVAVKLLCWAARRASAKIYSGGRVEYY